MLLWCTQDELYEEGLDLEVDSFSSEDRKSVALGCVRVGRVVMVGRGVVFRGRLLSLSLSLADDEYESPFEDDPAFLQPQRSPAPTRGGSDVSLGVIFSKSHLVYDPLPLPPSHPDTQSYRGQVLCSWFHTSKLMVFLQTCL